MHTTNEILDALAAKHGGASNYRLAKLLGCSSTATVQHWRNGRSYLSPDYAHRAAALLGWDPAYIVACVAHERAQRAASEGADPLEQTQEILTTWARIAEAFRPALPGILLVCAASLFAAKPASAQGFSIEHSAQVIDRSIHYAH